MFALDLAEPFEPGVGVGSVEWSVQCVVGRKSGAALTYNKGNEDGSNF